MKKAALSFILPFALLACSETPIGEQSSAEIAETEKQIEAEAQSLEEAAEEAVKTLETELAADGLDQAPPAASLESSVEQTDDQ